MDQHDGPIDCGDPPNNIDGDTSHLVEGDLTANPAIGADYTDPDNCSAPDPRRGCQIDLNEVSDGPMRLSAISPPRSEGSATCAPSVSIHRRQPAVESAGNLHLRESHRSARDADEDRFADLHLARY